MNRWQVAGILAVLVLNLFVTGLLILRVSRLETIVGNIAAGWRGSGSKVWGRRRG